MSNAKTIAEAHAAAVSRGERFYTDPETGLRVFTQLALEMRGYCCGSGCRHCPYHHASVPLGKREALIRQPAWLTDVRPPADRAVDVLFWSGGKDSWLAYRALGRAGFVSDVVLLTTFDAVSRTVAHQEVAIETVVRQAAHLGLALVGVPLLPGYEYVERVERGLELVPVLGRLVFGDLHLDSIRDWRERTFAALAERLGATLAFPVWQVPYRELLDDLEASGVAVEISAVTDARLAGSIGERYDREFVERLPADIDPMGERGEFHTVAKVWA